MRKGVTVERLKPGGRYSWCVSFPDADGARKRRYFTSRSEKKARELLAWKHSGFNLDAGEKPVGPSDGEGRRRLAEYLLRAPFSLEKITWEPDADTVIYRSKRKRNWRTKRNFQVFTAADFLAAAIQHIPPKSQQTVRYYGLYSNRRRGMDAKAGIAPPRLEPGGPPNDAPPPPAPPPTLFILPHPEARSARALKPLWRDLIFRTWNEDPLLCPACHGFMMRAGSLVEPGAIESLLRLHGLWEGIVSLPPPPRPPFDIDTLEPIEEAAQWSWASQAEAPPPSWWSGQSAEEACRSAWEAPLLSLNDGRILVLDAEPPPDDGLPVYHAG